MGIVSGQCWIYTVGNTQLEFTVEYPFIWTRNYWTKKFTAYLRVGKKGSNWGYKTVKKLTVTEDEVEAIRDRVVQEYIEQSLMNN